MSQMNRFAVWICCLFFSMTTVLHAEHVAVVAPRAFHRSLEPWIRHRTEQGWTVHVLVEPFGENATTPEKVKRRIETLAEQVPLSAVLLIGQGVARSEEFSDRVIPSPRFACRIIGNFGPEKYYVSDDWYADLDEDGLPDFPIGRLTVETAEELDAMVEKIIRYETEIEPGAWCRKLQIVAGIGNFSPLIDGAIESSARYALTEILPGSWDVSFLHANWKSPFCPSVLDFEDELIDSIDRGPLFWAYLGHGHHRRFEALDTPLGCVPTLQVERLGKIRCPDSTPVALLFCCYGGALDATTKSLAEELIGQPRGPVAVIAAPRTTMPYGMSVFGVELLKEWTRSQVDPKVESVTLGSLVLNAKRRMLEPPRPDLPEISNKKRRKVRPFRENLETLAKLLDPTAAELPVQLEEHAALFHLFGDPLLRLPRTLPIRLEGPEKVKPGQTVVCRGSFGEDWPEDDCPKTVRIEWTLHSNRLSLTSSRRDTVRLDAENRLLDNEEYRRSNDRVLWGGEANVREGNFSIELPIPADARGEYTLRAFGVSKKSVFLGSQTIAVERRRY